MDNLACSLIHWCRTLGVDGHRHAQLEQRGRQSVQDSDPVQQVPPPMAVSDDEIAQQLFAVSPARMLLGTWPSVLLDVVCPVVSYQVLTRLGVTDTVALATSAIFPLGAFLATVIRHRQVEALSVVSLLFIAAGVTVSLTSGNPRFILLSGSLFTGSFGVLFLLSLFLERPLAFYLGRQVMTGGKPEMMQRWDGLWKYRNFRRANRIVSGVWGSGLLLEALLRVLLALTLPTATFGLVWSPLSYVIYAGLIVWTILFGRSAAA